MTHTDTFVPALGHPLVARLYDPLLRLAMRERAFKGALVSAGVLDARETRRFPVPLGTVSLYRRWKGG